MAKGDTKTNQYLDIAANGTRADFPASCCETRSQTLIREVGERIMDLEDEVERLENNPDVADIVATYADLQSYDTSQLTDKDVIRVLQDETHDGDSTYYRWSTSTNTWTYIGESKQYTDFVGTDGTSAGEAGLVPAPTTTDAGKFLSASGLWEVVQSASGIIELTEGNTVIGGDPTLAFWLLEPGVYTFNKTSSENTRIQLTNAYSIGWWNNTMAGLAVVSEPTNSTKHVLFLQDNWAGFPIKISYTNSTTGQGSYEIVKPVDNLTSSANSLPLAATQGRVLKGLIDSISISGSGAPTTSTVGVVGQLYRDTTNGKLYICTDATNPYVWEEVGAGGGSGPTVVQATGTSTTDVMSQNAVTGMIFNTPSTTPSGIRIGYSATSSDNGTYGSVAIGRSSNAGVNNAVAIGGGATAGGAGGTIIGADAHGSTSGASVGVGFRAAPSGLRAVAIGGTTTASGACSIALGYYSEATLQGELNIGTGSQATSGFNSSNYRLIRGVYDGQSAHDAATYGQVISYSAINGAGAPTTATEGKYVGQLYYDTANEAMYFLKAIDTTTTPSTYTWEALGGGGSQYNIYSTKTTSNKNAGGAIYLGNLNANQEQQDDPTTTDAHRKYFWALPYANNIIPGSNSINILGEVTANNLSGVISLKGGDVARENTVAIGSQYTRSADSVAVGLSSVIDSSSAGGVALGFSAKVSAPGGIALGYQSSSTRAGEVNIGCTNSSYGYNNTNYRIITGVHDGIDAHSAATVGQITPLSDTTAPTTATVGTLGKIYIDTSTATAYMCVAVDDVTPSYTWKAITA